MQWYKNASQIDPLNKAVTSKLLFNQGLANSKLNEPEDAISNLTDALSMNPMYYKALVLRANCHIVLHDYEFTITDLESARNIEVTDEAECSLGIAKSALKKIAIRNKYYNVLEINTEATIDQIKKAYKRKIIQYHSDKTTGKTGHEKNELEKILRKIQEAYRVLCLCN